MADVAHFITGQLNRICYSHFFDILLSFKDSNYSELTYLVCSRSCAVRRPQNVSSYINKVQIYLLVLGDH